MTRVSLLLSAATALFFVLGLAACGASGAPSGTTTNAESGVSSQFALARCMRSHGVPGFPDPRPVTGGFSILANPGSSTLTVNGTTFEGPAFVAAEKTCKLFGGGTSPPPITASQKRAAVAFAECMRKHGVPNYPDPTFPAGGGIAQGPGINRNSPAVQAGAAVCGKAGS